MDISSVSFAEMLNGLVDALRRSGRDAAATDVEAIVKLARQ
jgi:hypothetical protein